MSLTGQYTNGIVSGVDGSELRGLRMRPGLTQAALADRLGVAPNSVARRERDERTIAEPIARLIRMTLEPAKPKRRGV